MLQTVKKKFTKLSNYPRLRILLIVIGVVVLFIIVMNLLSPAPVKPAPPPSQVEAVTPDSSSTANSKTAPANQVAQYQQLATANASATEQNTIRSGGSVFENAVSSASPAGTSQGTTPQQPSDQSANASDSSTAANPQNQQLTNQIAELQQQLAAQQQQQQAQLAQQQQQQQQNMNAEIQNIQSSMRTGLQNITDSWQLPTLATVQGQAPQPSTNTVSATAAGPVAIQAGTILFGVIDTALNSDQPGTPVLATVVTGPYKGAKLLGGFTAENDALVVQFNLMTLPQLQSSIPISAYAIDEHTANNAIASNVNNHYLLRYGMLFASAFLQGFGTAYQNTNYCPDGTQYCNIYSGGNNAPPNTTTTAQTAAYQGLGQIGTNLGAIAANQFNTPPTITVNQGTAIGVLFNNDVRIPLN